MTIGMWQGPVVHALAQALGWTLLHFLWQGALIAVVLWCALVLMERRSPDARYAAASLALLSMVVLPLLTFAHLATEEYSATLAQPVLVDATSFTVRAGTAGTTSWSAYLTPAVDRMMPSLMLVWSVGVVIFSCRLVVGMAVARGWKMDGIEDAPARLQGMFDDLRSRLGVKRAARLVESARVHVPMVIGWLKPVVLLPAGCLAGMSQQQVEALLAHELAHICRNDYLVSIVQSVLEAVLFYHPAVWWVSNQLRREREYCCDEMAVGVCGDRLAYARALSQLEEQRALLPELVLGANGGVLTMRIKRLLGYREDIASSNMVWIVVLVVVIAGGGSAIGRFALAESKPATAPMEQVSQNGQAAMQAAVVESERNAAQAEQQMRQVQEQSQAAQKQLEQAQRELAQATKKASAAATDQNQLDEAQKQQLENARKQVQAALEKLHSQEFQDRMKAVQEQIDRMNSPEFRKRMEAAAAAAAKVNSPEFRERLEDAQKRLQDSQELQKKMQAWINGPEFRKQMEDAGKQVEKFNTPEFRKKMQDLQQHVDKEKQWLSSPEFKKQLEDAQNQAAKANTPEFRARVEDMQKRVQEEMQKFNSPEYREKLRKMVEDAQKNSASFKFDSNALLVQNDKPSPAPEASPKPAPGQGETKSTSNTRVRVSANVAAGQAISRTPPVYPQEAKEHKIQGTVVLNAVIGKTGNVEHLNVVSGPKELLQSAMDAVAQWKYQPYLLNGQPVEVQTTINVTYSLDNPAPSSTPTPESNPAPNPAPQSSLTPLLNHSPMPVLLYKVSPEYTAETKAAKVQGPVVLSLVVDQLGIPENVRVVRSLNLALDQNAVEAVRQYRFRPAMDGGHPVSVPVNVEVQYQLR